SASRNASAEVNIAASKPPARRIRSIAWLMLASSSTTTILGIWLDISIRPGVPSTPDALACQESGRHYRRRTGAAELSLGASPIALWCRWTGVNVTVLEDREGSDSRGRDVGLELVGNAHQLGQRRDLHLLHHLRPVGLYRALRGAKFSCDLLVE